MSNNQNTSQGLVSRWKSGESLSPNNEFSPRSFSPSFIIQQQQQQQQSQSQSQSNTPMSHSNSRPINHRQSISVDQNNLARSFVYSSFKPERNSTFGVSETPTVHSGTSIQEVTAGLADVGLDSSDEDQSQSNDFDTFQGENTNNKDTNYDLDNTADEYNEIQFNNRTAPQNTSNNININIDVDNSGFIDDNLDNNSNFVNTNFNKKYIANDESTENGHSTLSDLLGKSIPRESSDTSINHHNSHNHQNELTHRHASDKNEDSPLLSEVYRSYTNANDIEEALSPHVSNEGQNPSTTDVESQKYDIPVTNESIQNSKYGSISLSRNNSYTNLSGAHFNQEQSPNNRKKSNNIQKNSKKIYEFSNVIDMIKTTDRSTIIEECIKKPVGYLPAVFLGTLLNILDGLSYGMIMFPIGEAVFSGMAPHGLSMFYLSCVISQLVYSLGGSAFKSGIGSEMIEVTPFFHSMAFSILSQIGEENQDAVISTTIVTFAVSSIVTGLVFFLLGKCKLGSLVGFFPRHILVGCIGGVGYFLVVTGIEVSSRLEGGLFYNLPTLKFLIQPLTLLQWSVPLGLTFILIVIQHHNNSALIVPLFFISVFILFHLLVLVVPSWSIEAARNSGWVFGAQETNEPWYGFYKLYNFSLVDWWVVFGELPSMLALTFFGVLHVPINVPALAVTIQMDEFDVDRELVAHGVSNALSGLLGSIQNYLVYTNSVLFIRAGADSRVAGVMLAIATGAVMMIGPVVIGWIPVCVVGSLIYLLGYELLKEALHDTFGKLKKFEYITIIIIVITMGAWDFVYGILVGILLACVSFVIEAARKPVVSGIYTGEYARSIVIRHPKQQTFLKDVGKQIYIMKLQGSLFFGSIGGLEAKARRRFDDSVFLKEPIRYLIFDMKKVLSIDFSAVEGFRRIRNLIIEKDAYFIISSVQENSEIVRALRDSGLWETEEHKERIQLFSSLNSALEWCENTFLETYKLVKSKHLKQEQQRISYNQHSGNGNNSGNSSTSSSPTAHQPINKARKSNANMISMFDDNSANFGSPRRVQLLKAASKTVSDEVKDSNNFNKIQLSIPEQRQKSQTNQHPSSPSGGAPSSPLSSTTYLPKTSANSLPAPLPLLLTVVLSMSERDSQFWVKLLKYLTKTTYSPGSIIYDKKSDQPSMFFVESGLISNTIDFPNIKFELCSSVLPLTAFGDVVSTKSDRAVRYVASTETVVWKISKESLQKLEQEQNEVYAELLVISLRLFTKRFDSVTSNILLSA